MTAVRAALVAMMCVGVGSLMHEQGTYALFAAQATNPANTFQVGTLKMLNSRAGNALFSASSGGGVVNPETQVTSAGGQVFAPLNPSMASYASPTLQGATPPILPNNPGFAVNGIGGIAPGMMLVNSVTVGNVGTLSAGRVRLTVPSITLTNNQAANCDPSNALKVNGVDVCGRGRLTDVLRVTAFYLAGQGRAVCVLGGPGLQGRVVAATNDGEAIAACAGPTLGASLVVAADGNGTFALAEKTTLTTTIVAGSTSGDRISPALASGIIVKNFRPNGTIVDDWEAGLERAITFAVAFDPAADNRYQGARASVDIKWDSTSLVGAPAGGVDTGVVVGSGTVSGTLSAPGIGIGANVSLVPMTANGQGYGAGWAATQTGVGGAFTFANVAPGNYAVTSVVDDVPVYRSISVNAGATTTVALEASTVETRTVTISPAGAATGTWTVEVGVLTGNAYANGVQPTFVGIGLQSQTVTNNTLSVKYRPADVSTTSVMIRKDTAPQLWFQTPMSSLLANGTVTVPTVSVSNLSCAGPTCTAAVGVSPTSNGWFNATLSRNGFNLASNGPINSGSGSATFSTAATGTFNLDVTANVYTQDGSNWSPVTVTKQVTIPATPQ